MSEPVAIVIVNGSSMLRADFAGEEAPETVIPSFIGVPLLESTTSSAGLKSKYIGQEAWEKRPLLRCQYPIDRGVITNWDAMEELWRHTFSNELRADPADHPVLLTEAVVDPKANREKMAEVMFETFNTPAMDIAIQAILAKYASDRHMGLSVVSGDGVTHVVPYREGVVYRDAIQRVDFGGRDLTDFMARLLAGRGYEFAAGGGLVVSNDVKEKLCYVAEDFDAEMQKAPSELERTYESPAGQVVTVGDERFRCAEALFQPSLMGVTAVGIHEACINALTKCDVDLQRDLYGNILLSGGNTMFPGLETRLAKEMVRLAPPTMKVKVIAPPERKYYAWIGGSRFAYGLTLLNNWVTKEDFEEAGPAFVLTKCQL